MNTDTPYEVSGLNPAEAAAAAGQDAVIPSESITVSADGVEAESESAVEVTVEATEAAPATAVSDDMTFAQAFAAARAEYGPGAAFTWHGQVYGTYYQSEWNAMTPAEQHAFTASALDHGPVNTPLEVTVDDTDYAAVEPIVDDEDTEVRILGYDSYGDDGEKINIAALSVNDEPVIMIDLDNDNVYDYAIADFDHSNKIMDTDNDIVDISQYNITTDNIAALDSPVEMADDMAQNMDNGIQDVDDMAIVDGI